MESFWRGACKNLQKSVKLKENGEGYRFPDSPQPFFQMRELRF